MPTPVAVIDAAGITVPTYGDVLTWVQEQYQGIYGADIDIDADTQDGQWLAILAQALHDANQTTEATYHAYSPTYAQGGGLSSVVKTNGIRRHVATTGTVLLKCVGIAGRDLSGGIVADDLNQQGVEWQLPPRGVIIPPSGEIQVTATCLIPGDNRAGIGTITRIVTPVPGWQSVTNLAAATPGLAVESDAELRRRQTFSVANPSQTVVVGIQGAIATVPGVRRVLVYENPSSVADANGIPPYSMAAVVEGGDADGIAEAIALRKTPGSPTYGTTTVLYYDQRGIPSTIHYFPLTVVPITVEITLTAFVGFSQAVADLIIAQVIAYFNGLPIGYDAYYTKLVAACEINSAALLSVTDPPPNLLYEVTAVRQARDGGALGTADIAIAFTEAAFCELPLITINVTSTLRGRRPR